MSNLLNDLLVPGAKAPETLNTMYTRAAAYILPRNVSRNGRGAVFATRADDLRDTGRVRGGRGGAGRSSTGRGNSAKGLKPNTAAAAKAKEKREQSNTCWECGKQGHRLCDCPQNNGSKDGDGEEH